MPQGIAGIHSREEPTCPTRSWEEREQVASWERARGCRICFLVLKIWETGPLGRRRVGRVVRKGTRPWASRWPLDEHPGATGAGRGNGRTGPLMRERAQCGQEHRFGSDKRGSLLITGLKGAECSPGQAGLPAPVLQSETVPNQGQRTHWLKVRHKFPQTQRETV